MTRHLILAVLLAAAAWAGGKKGSGWSDDGTVYCGPVCSVQPDGGSVCNVFDSPACKPGRWAAADGGTP